MRGHYAFRAFRMLRVGDDLNLAGLAYVIEHLGVHDVDALLDDLRTIANFNATQARTDDEAASD